MRYRTGGKLIRNRRYIKAKVGHSYTSWTSMTGSPYFSQEGDMTLILEGENEKTVQILINQESIDWLNYIFKNYSKGEK